MAKRPRRHQRKRVILSPEIVDDSDEEVHGGGIPDDHGWVYLKRKEARDGKQERRRKPGRKR